MPDQNPCSPETKEAIKKALSTSRIRPYLNAVHGDTDKALKIYQLNLELCAALYPSLHIFEVTFRNQIDQSLQKKYPLGNWFNLDFLEGIDKKSIEDAKKQIEKAQKPLAHNRIVAELSLGFWCGLITKKIYKKPVFDQCIK